MPVAARVRRLLSPEHIQPELFLAGGATTGLVLMAAGRMAGTDQPAALVVAAVTVVLLAAARERHRGRPRRASIIAAAAIVAAMPLLALLHPMTFGLSLLAPLAFALAVPHLRGAEVLALALAATLAAVVAAGTRVLATGNGESPLLVAIASMSVALIAGVLLLIVWRMHRRALTTDARLRTLAGDVPVGIARSGPDGRFLEINDAFARTLGYPDAATMSGLDYRGLFEDPAAVDSLRRRLASSGTIEGEIRMRRADGGPVWVWYRVRAERDADGRPRWFDTVIDDISDSRAEQESRNLLAAVTDSAMDAVVALGLDGSVLSWNAGAAAIFGWSRDELVGRSIEALVPADELEDHRAALREVAEGRFVGPREVRRLAKDGREVVVSLSLAPARDADGVVVAAAAIGRDVTDERRRRAEQASLEAQLRQAQKMEAVGRLAGGVAHDFNNLLTAILGYGQLVADGLTGTPLDDQQQVLGAATRASQLVSRMLEFTRESPLDPRTVAVDDVVGKALAMVTRLVPETVTLEARLEARAHVLADPLELEQAMLNLLTNAVEAMPDGGRVVVATSLADLTRRAAARTPDLRPGLHVTIQVRDEGVGMDDVTLARAVEPFFTTKGSDGRSGLGLPSVFGVAQRARGQLEIDSTVGRGTTVSLILPVVPAQDADATVARRFVPPGSERVLLVEDDPGVRQVAARVLERARYDVTVAGSPHDALETLARGPFDAVVSDVIMPGMTGADLAERLPPDLPLVFMSGYPGSAMPALGLDRPTRAFVAKPFEPVVLAGAVRRVLDAASVAPPPLAQPATSAR